MKKIITLAVIVFSVWACNQSSEKEQESSPQELKPSINYLGVSVGIAKETKKGLGGELKAALERGGVEEAVAYCNANALPLTDSIAARYNATIKRATNKPRNPLNRATRAELKYIAQFQKEIDENGKVNAVVEEKGDSIHFFAPIALDAFCLTCHGAVGETMSAENYAHIAEKYPEDKAVGYTENDLRGVWHISYPKIK